MMICTLSEAPLMTCYPLWRRDSLSHTKASPKAAINLFNRVYRGSEAKNIAVHISPMSWRRLKALMISTIRRGWQIQVLLPIQVPVVVAHGRFLLFNTQPLSFHLRPGNGNNDAPAGECARFVPLRTLGDYNGQQKCLTFTFPQAAVRFINSVFIPFNPIEAYMSDGPMTRHGRRMSGYCMNQTPPP